MIPVTDDTAAANALMKDLDPSTPQEYILKGVVNAAVGYEQGSVRRWPLIIMLYTCDSTIQ